MGIAPNANIDCQSGGSATNGGFFDSTVTNAGTDYSLSTSPIITLTDVAAAQNSTTITSAAGLFTSAMVGNGAWFSAGDNFITTVPRYITAVNSATEAVLDTPPATAGNGTNGAMKVGGAWALPTSNQWTALVGGNTVHFKASATYTLSGSLTAPSTPSGQTKISIRSYTTTHGDAVPRASFPKIAMGTNNMGLSSAFDIEGVWIESARSAGITVAISSGVVRNSKITNTANNSISAAMSITSSAVMGCEISCQYAYAVSFSGGTLANNKIHSSVTGILVNASQRSTVIRNVIRGNTTGLKFTSSSVGGNYTAWNAFYANTTAIAVETSKFQIIDENIIHTSMTGITDSASNPTINPRRNIFYLCDTNANNIVLDSTNQVNTNPLWTDPANDDYSITYGSPAINIGYDFANLGILGSYKWNAGISQADHLDRTTCHMSAA